MKHTLKITIILAVLFLLSHLVGLFVVNQYTSVELPYGIERPVFDGGSSYAPLLVSILIASLLIMMIIRFNAVRVWKVWFIFATIYLLGIAFTSFVTSLVALFLAIVLGLLKFYRSSVIIHNFTELFVYSGIAAIFSPVMSVFSASVLLIIISIYDMIAVWKTKHMVSIAKFQTKAKMFAGLAIPYGKKTAILGGGDIGFTLLFSGVVLIKLGVLQALIVSLFTTLALFLLLVYSSKNKFYPAMPYLSAGCFLGLLISFLV
jgi:presenilin-like A22 family membrane protease